MTDNNKFNTQFRELFEEAGNAMAESFFTGVEKMKSQFNPFTTPKKNLKYGLVGIMEIFGCSKSTAYRLKKSGKIDKAISQYEKTIIIDADLALELLRPKRGHK